MDDERAGKARRRTRNSTPSPQEEVEWRNAAARLGFEARIAEAYTALEAMLETEERMGLQFEAEGADLPYEKAKYRYDGTMEEGGNETPSRNAEKEWPRKRLRIQSLIRKAKSGGFGHLSPTL